MEPQCDDNYYGIPRDRSNTWPMQQYVQSNIPSYHPSQNSSGYPSTSSINTVGQQQLPDISLFGSSGSPAGGFPFYNNSCEQIYQQHSPESNNNNSPEIPCDPAPSSQEVELDSNGKPKRKRIRKKDPDQMAQKKPNRKQN